jgi:hypothetical protein
MTNLYYISDDFAVLLNLSTEEQYTLDEVLQSLFIYASKNNLTEICPEYNIYILNEDLKRFFEDFDNTLLLNNLQKDIDFLENVSNHPLYPDSNISIETKKVALHRLKNISFIDIQNNQKNLLRYLLEKEHLERV